MCPERTPATPYEFIIRRIQELKVTELLSMLKSLEYHFSVHQRKRMEMPSKMVCLRISRMLAVVGRFYVCSDYASRFVIVAA